MNKAEREYAINMFLAENDLRNARGAPVRSVEDLKEESLKGTKLRERRSAVIALLKSYKERTSANPVTVYSTDLIYHMDLMRFPLNPGLEDLTDEDFAVYLDYVRALCEGLTVAFPPKRTGEAAND